MQSPRTKWKRAWEHARMAWPENPEKRRPSCLGMLLNALAPTCQYIQSAIQIVLQQRPSNELPPNL